MNDDIIFTPLKFRNLEVKNRVFHSNISGRFDRLYGFNLAPQNLIALAALIWSTLLLGIVGRNLIAILYILLGGGFLWLALFDGLFGLALYVTYRRVIISELQTRP